VADHATYSPVASTRDVSGRTPGKPALPPGIGEDHRIAVEDSQERAHERFFTIFAACVEAAPW
jgi:hypothetical protein